MNGSNSDLGMQHFVVDSEPAADESTVPMQQSINYEILDSNRLPLDVIILPLAAAVFAAHLKRDMPLL